MCRVFLRRELEYFLLALAFFTRIPVPSWVNFSSKNLKHASRYYAVVGFIIGTMTVIVFLLFHLFFSTSVSVILSMIFSILLTGAFHEDGLADCCDGFWGGYTIEKKLEIMKDSRVGTYGVVGLTLTLLLKWQLLIELDILIPMAMIVSHTISRMLAGSVMFALPYARVDTDSKVKAYTAQNSGIESYILYLTTFLIAFVFLSLQQLLILSLLLILIRQLFIGYFRKALNGYTGDCLGAVQQLTEISIYLTLLHFL